MGNVGLKSTHKATLRFGELADLKQHALELS